MESKSECLGAWEVCMCVCRVELGKAKKLKYIFKDIFKTGAAILTTVIILKQCSLILKR